MFMEPNVKAELNFEGYNIINGKKNVERNMQIIPIRKKKVKCCQFPVNYYSSSPLFYID